MCEGVRIRITYHFSADVDIVSLSGDMKRSERHGAFGVHVTVIAFEKFLKKQEYKNEKSKGTENISVFLLCSERQIDTELRREELTYGQVFR